MTPNKPKLLDTVRLLEAALDHGLTAGATGVIVEIFDRPPEAYEVEFCDRNGATVAQLTLSPEQFELV
ncbi:MAG: DUF4926 domain-containing protein [Hyphomonas sp.]